MCHQSGAVEAWWAHNPQVPGSKPGFDTFLHKWLIMRTSFLGIERETPSSFYNTLDSTLLFVFVYMLLILQNQLNILTIKESH